MLRLLCEFVCAWTEFMNILLYESHQVLTFLFTCSRWNVDHFHGYQRHQNIYMLVLLLCWCSWWVTHSAVLRSIFGLIILLFVQCELDIIHYFFNHRETSARPSATWIEWESNYWIWHLFKTITTRSTRLSKTSATCAEHVDTHSQWMLRTWFN